MKAKAKRTLRQRALSVLLAVLMLMSIPFSTMEASAWPNGGWFGPNVLTNASVTFKDSRFQNISEVDSGSLFYLMITIAGNNVHQRPGAENTYRVEITDNNLLLPNFAGNGFVDGAVYNGFTLHNQGGKRYIEFSVRNGDTKAIRLQAKFANGTTPDDTKNTVNLVQVSSGKSLSNTITANSSIQWSASKAEDRTQLKAADVANGTTVNYTLNAAPSNPTRKTGAWWLEGLEYNDTIELTDAAFASGAKSSIEASVENMLKNSGYKYDSVNVTVNGSKADISFKVYSKDTTSEMTAPSLTLPLNLNNKTITLESGKNAAVNNSLSVKGKPINGNDFSYDIGGNDVSLNIEAPQGPKFSINKSVDGNSSIIYDGSTSQTVTYKITVNNYGDTPGDITVEDVPKTAGLTLNGDSSYTFKDVKPGESQSITVECSLDETVLDYTGNIASVCNRVQDKDDNTNYSDAYITVEKATSNLNASKSGYVTGENGNQKQTFSAGDTVTYTINISNNGKADASNVTFEDTIDSNLTNITVEPAAITVNENGNQVSGIIDSIPANGSATITITGTVVDNPTKDTISNTAQVDGKNTNEVVFTKDQPSLNPSKDGYVNKAGNYSYIGVGTDNAVYTITINNNGESDAKDVKVEDNLPEGFVASSYVIDDGSEVAFTGTKFETTVDVPKNSSVKITIKGTIKEGQTQAISNTASITYNGETKGTGTVYFNKASGNIGMYKTVEPNNFIEGTETDTTWKIYVSNNGSAKAERVNITDNVPTGATFESYSIESNKEGSANITSNTALDGNLDLTLDLEEGENITIIIKGKVSGTKSVTNKASFKWGEQGYETSATSNVKDNPNKYVAEKWIVDENGDTLVDKDGKVQNGFSGFPTTGGQKIVFRMAFENNSSETIKDLQISDYCYWVRPESTDSVLDLKVVESKNCDLKVGDISQVATGYKNPTETNSDWYIDLHDVNLQSGGRIVIEYTGILKGLDNVHDDSWALDGDFGFNNVAFANINGGALNSAYYKSAKVKIPWDQKFGVTKQVCEGNEGGTVSNMYDQIKITDADKLSDVVYFRINLKPDGKDSTNYTDTIFTITDKLPDGMVLASDYSPAYTDWKDGVLCNDSSNLTLKDVFYNAATNEITFQVQPKNLTNNNLNGNTYIVYAARFTPQKINALKESSEETVTNTVTKVSVTKDGQEIHNVKPNATADVKFKPVRPAPGFAKIAYASFASGMPYEEGDTELQHVENGLITAGDNLIWRTVVYNGNGDTSKYNADNTANLKGYAVTDTLPDSYSYDADKITNYPCSIKICGIGADGKPDDKNVIKTLDYIEPTANGKNYTWNFSDEKYTLEPNQCLVIEFATIADVAVEGVVTNTGYAKIDQPFTVEDTVAGEKKDDTIHSYANYNIAGLTTESWKTIHYENEGHKVSNGDLHDDPDSDTGEGRNPVHNYVQGMQGEKVTYTVNVQNNSPADLNNMSIIDRLPYEGDRGLVSGYDRNSAFGVQMGTIESVAVNGTIVDYTVSYSNNKTAVLNEYSKDWVGQDDAMTWTETRSDDSVNFRVMIDSGVTIKPEDKVKITFTGYVPKYVANTGEENIAWNSFAYSYQSDMLPGTVMVAEPAKVGVWVKPTDASNSITINKTLEGTKGGTYYFAIFNNKNERLSDIVSMTLDSDAVSGSITMENLDFDQIANGNGDALFIRETDAKGNILGEQTTSPYKVTYDNDGKIDTAEESQTVEVTNTLEVDDITVNKVMTANTAKADTFYFALFTKDGDKYVRYEDAAVQSVTLNAVLNDDTDEYTASGSVTFRDVPKGTDFYVLETNENGVPADDLSTYTSKNGNIYTVEQNGEAVQAGGTATIENTENAVYSIKVSKVLSSKDIKTLPKFNVGLFTESDGTYTLVEKKEIVSGSDVTFDKLDPAKTYYVFELDGDTRLSAGAEFTRDDIKITTSDKESTSKKFVVSYDGCGDTPIEFKDAKDSSKSVVVTNTDTPEKENLAKISVTKSVVNEDGSIISDYNGTFYVGLYTYSLSNDGEEKYELKDTAELEVQKGTGSAEFNEKIKADSKTTYVVYELNSKSDEDNPCVEGSIITSGTYKFNVSYPGGTQLILEPGVPGTMNITNTEVKDIVLSFNKCDAEGNSFEGAEMTLSNSDGIVETWTSGKEPKTFVNLDDGSYTLTESSIPGYAPLSVEFEIKDGYFVTLDEDKQINSFTISPTALTIYNRSLLNVSKVDIADETTELAGAEICITLNDTDKFLSGVELSRGGSELTRVISFSDDNVKNGYDEYIIDGNTIKFFSNGENDTVITGLIDGDYTISEITAPDGYTTVESHDFTIANGVVKDTAPNDSYDVIGATVKTTNKIVMKDSKEKYISISKQDISDSSELPGAKLSVIFDGDTLNADDIKLTRTNAQGNAEALVLGNDYTIDGNTITFTSADASTKIYGLPDGSYTLREVAAPNGYQVITDFLFAVSDGKITTEQPTDREDISVSEAELVVKDSASEVEINKCDITGKVEVAGATLQLTVNELAEGVTIDWAKVMENAAIAPTVLNGNDGNQNGIEWTSADDSAQIIKYLPDGTYTLKETGGEFESDGVK